MTLPLVLLALLSAVLHAGWNAAVKVAPRPTEAMAAQMIVGALMVVPILAVIGLPKMASWPWVAASTATNVVTVLTMMRAYRAAEFGVVYPVMRAIGVLLVVPLSTWIAREAISGYAIGGVVLIVAALALLARSAATDRSFPPAALGWALASGGATAVYVLCDAQGVRAAGDAFAYGCLTSVTNALAMCIRLRREISPIGILKGSGLRAIPVAVASMASYILILWVWTQGPIAPAAALRDTSAVFAILIAVVWLRERLTPVRLAAVVLAAIAIPLLRLA